MGAEKKMWERSNAMFSNNIEWEFTDTLTDDGGQFIHSVSTDVNSKLRKSPRKSDGLTTATIFLHGYANGLSYFSRILPLMLKDVDSSQIGSKIYACDLAGFGLSSRGSSFPAKTNDEAADVAAAEDYFLKSLESWRVANKIDKLNICGHSLGGYVAATYTERHPENVNKLVLLSPVGTPFPPSTEESSARLKNLSWGIYTLIMTVRKVWSTGYTPGMVIRGLPNGYGKSLVGKYVNGRLGIDGEEGEILTDYSYGVNMMKGEGEFCLDRLLKPGAYARSPLLPRFPRIPSIKAKDVTFIYGSKDWMDYKGGVAARDLINSQEGDGECRVYLVKDAGHLLILENPEGTVQAIKHGAFGIGSVGGGDNEKDQCMLLPKEDKFFKF